MFNNNRYGKIMRAFPVNSPGYSLRRASNAMTADLVQRLAKHDIRLVDATVLLLIGDNPNITASAVGRALDIQRANMVPLLKRLEDAGFVERSPIDGKSQGLSLTETGQVQFEAVRKTVLRFEDELTQRVPENLRPYLLPVLDSLWR